MNMSTRPNVKWILVILLFVAGIVQAADWPTYRHDNSRSGASSETLGTPLHLQWEYQPLHGPQPAWSARSR